MSLVDRQVPCTCSTALSFPIGEPVMVYPHDLFACVGCGLVALCLAVVDEPRPHDVRLVGFKPIPLAPKVSAWLGRIPRRVGDRAWLPASVRVQGVDEVDAAAIRAENEPLIDALHRAGMPADRPPELPHILRGAKELWEMDPRSRDLAQWVGWCDGGGRRLAYDRLRYWPGAVAGVVALLGDGLQSTVAAHLICELGVGDPAAIGWVAAQLDAADAGTVDELRDWVNSVSWQVQKLQARELASRLPALADRLDPNRDHYAIKYLREVAARVQAGGDSDSR